jgi:hypothetical protein
MVWVSCAREGLTSQSACEEALTGARRGSTARTAAGSTQSAWAVVRRRRVRGSMVVGREGGRSREVEGGRVAGSYPAVATAILVDWATVRSE